MFSSIFLGTLQDSTPLWELGLLLAVIFLAESLWNALVARIFSFEQSPGALYQPENHHRPQLWRPSGSAGVQDCRDLTHSSVLKYPGGCGGLAPLRRQARGATP